MGNLNSENLTQKKWFIYVGDHHEGPFSLSEIQAKLQSGQITSDQYTWAEGMQDWKMMTEVSEFEAILPKTTSTPPPATPPQEPAAPFVPQIQVEDRTQPIAPVVNQPAPAPSPQALKKKQKEIVTRERRPRRPARWVRPFIFLMLIATAAVAYMQGYMRPVLDMPFLAGLPDKIEQVAQPLLIRLSHQFPALSRWVSPIPKLPHVSQEDYEELRSAAGANLAEVGPSLGLGLSHEDPLAPQFYVATNLPDGTQFDISIRGVKGTLLNKIRLFTSTQVSIHGKLGKTEVLKFPDGKPIPRGEYEIFVTESANQSKEVNDALSKLRPVPRGLPAFVHPDRKLIARKKYFLGGNKDNSYAERLKAFHEKLTATSKTELMELRQYMTTLFSQYNSSVAEFKGLSSGKITRSKKAAWQRFHKKWSGLTQHLLTTFERWKIEGAQEGTLHRGLYDLTREAGIAVDKMHQAQTEFFLKGASPAEASALAQEQLTLLKSRIEKTEALPATPTGMPGILED